ncbi:hypothetical protein Tco_0860790 [Tanacetum coccineum]|uniref:Uncharacterized protein n=1 Tax=Tanacetum coccineum TaxID=301880 RepID=A0ABQ5BGT0_9ASTR
MKLIMDVSYKTLGALFIGSSTSMLVTRMYGVTRSSINVETMGTHDDEAGSSRPKRSRQYKTMKEVLLPQVHHEFLEWEGCNRDAKSRNKWNVKDNLSEVGTNEEIFTSVAWISAFNINEPIYSELCHEFYSTYEFDEDCADDELKTKKIIKFRLGGRAHSLTYREENLSLSRSHADIIRNPVLRVLHKMITYGLYHRTTGYDKIQKNVLWLLSMFDARHQNGYANVAWLIARKARVLNDEVIRSLSAPIYCRYLDTITLKELIDSEGRLIPEDPQPGVPRVDIPRPQRASMQDLYVGVFEHMAGVYSVSLQGAYNPLGYDQQQYDQYYQQYPPQQQQQQPDNDDEFLIQHHTYDDFESRVYENIFGSTNLCPEQEDYLTGKGVEVEKVVDTDRGPDKYVSRSSTTDILSSDYDSSQFTSFESDDDVKILLQCTLPSLWSQNSVVVHAAVGIMVVKLSGFTDGEVAFEAIALEMENAP